MGIYIGIGAYGAEPDKPLVEVRSALFALAF